MTVTHQATLYPGHTTVPCQATSTLVTRQSHAKQLLPWSHDSTMPSNLYPGHTTVTCQATLYSGHTTVTHHLTPPPVLAAPPPPSLVRSAARARTLALVLVGRSTARDPPVLQTACVGHLAVPVCVGVCVCVWVRAGIITIYTVYMYQVPRSRGRRKKWFGNEVRLYLYRE